MFKKCKNCKKDLLLYEYRSNKKNIKVQDSNSYKVKTYHANICKKCQNIRARELHKKPKSRYNQYIYSAKRKNLKFDLTFEEFLLFEDKPCHYCGDIPDVISLDRLDNDLGYTLKNISSCCHICNYIKHINEEQDFLKQVEKIYLYQQKVKYEK